VQGGAVLLTRVPAHGLDGAQASVHGAEECIRVARLCGALSCARNVVDEFKIAGTENVQSRSNTPLSVYDTEPGSTDAPPEADTQILAARQLHMNVTVESKKWIFIGIVALVVLEAAGIVVPLVANFRSRRAANKQFGF
jgi:hypothetical protein